MGRILSGRYYKIIDILKGICILWVIMLHAIPAGEKIYKFLLMPFYAQLTIPFFMVISGFTNTLSYEKYENWYTFSKLWKKVKRFVIPFIPALVLELFVLGRPENLMIWLLQGGYQMPGSYYIIIMIQLVLLFPCIYAFYYQLHVKRKLPWIFGIVVVFGFQCVYELFTYLIDLDVQIYRLLIFRYCVFLYAGIVLYKVKKEHKIFWKGTVKFLPFGFLYIFLVGYMNWQPEILFRYSTWYRSAAPVICWVAPIAAYLIENGDAIVSTLKSDKVWNFISEKVQLIGQASYHIYIVQMLWFGLIVSHINTNSWKKMVICIISMFICSVLGVIYYHINKYIEETFFKGTRTKSLAKL